MDDEKTRLETRRKPGSGRSAAFDAEIIRTPEEARVKGSAGGKKSGAVRKEQSERRKDAREAIRYLLDMAAKGKLDSNLQELGFPESERTNMAALQARLFTMAMSGNLEAYMTLMRMAGYEPEENRKERESVAADRRREAELDAKVTALGGNPDGMRAAVNMKDEDGDNDVVIYMPEISSEESCEMKEADESFDGEAPQKPAEEQ